MLIAYMRNIGYKPTENEAQKPNLDLWLGIAIPNTIALILLGFAVYFSSIV